MDGSSNVTSLLEFKKNCELYVKVLDNPGINLQETLNNFLTWIQWIRGGHGTVEHEAYFFETALPDMGVAVLRREYSKDNAERISRFLYSVVDAAVSRLQSQVRLSEKEDELLCELFNPGARFYAVHGHVQPSPLVACAVGGTKTNHMAGADARESWVEELGVHQLVQVEIDGNWQLCRVFQVSPTNTEMEVDVFDPRMVGDLDKIDLTNAEFFDSLDVSERRWVFKDAETLRPPGEATTKEKNQSEIEAEARLIRENSVLVDNIEDEPWRTKIMIGDMIDARSCAGIWYQALVVEILSHEIDSAMDTLKIAFVGFTLAQDELICRSSRYRLAPLNVYSQARRGPRFAKSVDNAYADSQVVDTNDPQDGFVVERNSKQSTTSRYLVQCIKSFGELGGFNYLLNRIKRNTATFHALHAYVQLIAKVAPLMISAFAQSFIIEFVDAVISSLEQYDSEQVRSFSKALVNGVIDGLNRSLYRIIPVADAAALTEPLAILLAKKRIESEAIKQRLDALMSVNDIVDSVNNALTYPAGLRIQTCAAQSYSSESVCEGKFDVVSSAVAAKFARFSNSSEEMAPEEDTPPPNSCTEGKTELEYVRVPIARFFTRTQVCEWYLSTRSFEDSMLGPKAHHEIVKRMDKLVQLMIQCDRFDSDRIELLFGAIECSFGSDNELLSALYALLQQSVKIMEYRHLCYLLSSLQALPKGKYTEGTLQLLGEIVKSRQHCVPFDESRLRPSLCAFDVMWSFLTNTGDSELGKMGHNVIKDIIDHYTKMDMIRTLRVDSTSSTGESTANTSVSKPIAVPKEQVEVALAAISMVANNMQAIPPFPGGVIFREMLIERCLNKMGKGGAILAAFATLRNVIESFPATSHRTVGTEDWEHLNGSESRGQVLAWLNTKHKFLNTCLSALVASSKDPNGRTAAFGFLTFILTDSNLVLSSDQVDILWGAFVLSGEPSNAASLFVFLQHSAESGIETGFHAFSENVLEYVFTEKLCQVTTYEVSLAGFKCFQAFFLQVNLKHGNLVHAKSKGTIVNSVNDVEFVCLPLVGQDVLWHFALAGDEEQVGAVAGNILSNLQLRFTSCDHEEMLKQRILFVDECFAKIRTFSKDLKDPEKFLSAAQRIRRCIGVLKSLLECSREEASWVCQVLGVSGWKRLAPHSGCAREEVLEISVSNNFRGTKYHGEKLFVRLYSTDPVWKFRSEIARCIGLDRTNLERLRLFASGKEIRTNLGTTALKDIQGFSSGTIVLAHEKPLGESAKQQNQSVSPSNENIPEAVLPKLDLLPGTIIAGNPKYHQDLFNLLDVCCEINKVGDGDLIHEVNNLESELWEILEGLPSDQTLSRGLDVMSEEAIDFMNAQDDNILRLLYMLQLLESHFVPYRRDIGFAVLHEEEQNPLRDCDEVEEQKAWFKNFVRIGGPGLLLNKFTQVVKRLQFVDLKTPVLFETTQLYACLAKLSKIVLQCISAEVLACCKDTIDERLLDAVQPSVPQLVKLQKEIDISGGLVLTPYYAFPYSPITLQRPKAEIALVQSETDIEFIRVRSLLKEFSECMSADENYSPAIDYEELSISASVLLENTLCRCEEPITLAHEDRFATDEQMKQILIQISAWGMGVWVLTTSFCSKDAFLKQKEILDTFLRRGLCATGGNIPFLTRQIFKHGLYTVSCCGAGIWNEFAQLLLNVDPPTSSEFVSDEYFVFCRAILTECRDPVLLAGAVNILKDKLRQSGSCEEGYASSSSSSRMLKVDHVLVGRIRLMSSVLGLDIPGLDGLIDKMDLAQFVLGNCLFGAREDRLCHRPTSREVAFALVATLMNRVDPAHISEMYMLISQYIDKNEKVDTTVLDTFLANKDTDTSKWSVDLNVDEVAPCGFVGLVNLGFICYMNSLIQQLFMIPRLRYAILLAREENESSDGLLFQLQRMFAHLDISMKKAYKPDGWCLAFKDENGQPVNIWQQQDAHEFFNSLCDRLDERLEKSALGKVLTRTLGVTIANQLICIEDTPGGMLRKENPPVTEYCLTQELNPSISTLHESLKSFVTGEVLNDYRWETHGDAKLRTQKRQCIANLNDVVFIHLKRFRLNWETFTTEKINCRFEFPLDLDFFPYTKEGLEWSENSGEKYAKYPREYYNFSLAGIVVHSGATLNSGHYYSFIRSRLGSTAGSWYEFNDRIVSPFRLEDLEEATFGGGVNQTNYGVQVPSVNNAYMLVYERVVPMQKEEDLLLYPKDNVSIDSSKVSRACSALKEHQPLSMDLRKAIVPVDIFSELELGNRAIDEVQCAFDPSFRHFFVQATTLICDSIVDFPRDPSTASFILLTTSYAVHTFSRSADTFEFPTLMTNLGKIYAGKWTEDSIAWRCLDLIIEVTESEGLLVGLLLHHPVNTVRESFCEFVIQVISGCNIDDWHNVRVFAKELLRPLKNGDVKRHWQRQDEYFQVVRAVCVESMVASEIMLDQCVIAFIVDLFLGDSTSVLQDEWDHRRIGPRPSVSQSVGYQSMANWNSAFDCMSILVKQTWPFDSTQVNPDPSLELGKRKVEDFTLQALRIQTFYEDSLALAVEYGLANRDNRFFQPVVDMMTHICFEWEAYSFYAMQVLMHGLELCNSTAGIPIYFHAIKQMINVEDFLQMRRVATFLFGPSNIALAENHLEDDGLRQLREQSDGISVFRVLKENKWDDIAYCLEYVEEVLKLVVESDAVARCLGREIFCNDWDPWLLTFIQHVEMSPGRSTVTGQAAGDETSADNRNMPLRLLYQNVVKKFEF